jgi:ubiquitin carboxyl-terminal hydrolase 47
VYELFSIMIHSGSAAGGHYYAYIKSFTDGQWYSFNDQQVSKVKRKISTTSKSETKVL